MNKWGNGINQPLVYIGITINEEDRYSSSTIQHEYMRIIASNLTKAQARGIEQLLIELNNSGLPYPGLSNTLDNKINSTSPDRPEYYTRKIKGLIWLEENRPNWRTRYKKTPEQVKLEIGK